jgi:hypothetical protein
MAWYYLLVLAFPVTVIISRTDAGDSLLVRPVSWFLGRLHIPCGFWERMCDCPVCIGFWVVAALSLATHATLLTAAIAYTCLLFASATYDTLTQHGLPE